MIPLRSSLLIALAKESEAHYLVTGDTRDGFLERHSIGHTEIMTASEFCRRLGI